MILAGLADAFTPINLLYVLAGVVLGQFVGAVPGLSAPMAMAIAVPFTFTLNPLAAIAFLVGVNKGGTVGGAIPAVLLNTPGQPDAAATALDGHPMARDGKPGKAMKTALFASVTGDTMSDLVLITLAPPLALVALKMGPAELSALMLLALCVIAGLVGDSMTKGIYTAGLGLLAASVGLDPESGTARLAFGRIEVYDGLPLEAVAVGLLAVGQLFTELLRRSDADEAALPSSGDQAANRFRWADYQRIFPTCLRGGAIGTVIGAIPGVGSTAAAFMSYAMAKRASRTPERFGNGAPEGIAATESANSAVVGANLIPLLTLGIPGNVTAALIVGAFVIQGIQPGPLLFREQGQLIYGLFGAMMMANAMNLCTGLVGLRFWSIVMKLPRTVIMPTALLLCIVGTYVTTGGMFGVGLMLAFGIVGWLMRVFGFPFVPFIIAFVIGPQFEYTIVQTLVLSDGGFDYVLGRPVALALLALCVFTIWKLGFAKPKPKPKPKPA